MISMLFITKMIESDLQKQLQKTFSNLGRHSGRIFNENNSGADGLRTKTYRFFGFGWYQNRRKIDEESIKNIFSDPGFKANFLRFGVDFWVSLRAKMMKNVREKKTIEF